jgi:hypothetical protein
MANSLHLIPPTELAGTTIKYVETVAKMGYPNLDMGDSAYGEVLLAAKNHDAAFWLKTASSSESVSPVARESWAFS